MILFSYDRIMPKRKHKSVFTNRLARSISTGLFCITYFVSKKDFMNCSTIKMNVMKFLLIILAIRFVFFLLDRIGKKEEFDMDEYEDGPSEHNVWW